MVPPVPVLLKLLTVAPTLRVVALTAPVNDPVPVTFCRVRALTPETDVPVTSLPLRVRLKLEPVTAPKLMKEPAVIWVLVVSVTCPKYC